MQLPVLSSRQLGQQHCLELPHNYDHELHRSVSHARLISASVHLLTAVHDSVGNTNPSVMPQPQAIIAIQPGFDCSEELTADQDSTFQPGDGYFVQMANPLNDTDVRAPTSPYTVHI